MGRGMICSPRGASAVSATPLFAAPELVISCSATDWLAELDGGPGGSDAAVDRLLPSPPATVCKGQKQRNGYRLDGRSRG